MADPTATVTEASAVPDLPAAPVSKTKEAADLVTNMRELWVRSGNSPANRIDGYLPKFSADSPLLTAHKELMKDAPTGVDVTKALNKLETLIEEQKSNLSKGFGFDQAKWDASFVAANTAIQANLTADPSDANKAASIKAQENLKKLQTDKLNEEMANFSADIERQKETANQQRVYEHMMDQVKSDNLKLNDMQARSKVEDMFWEKLTGMDNSDIQDELDALTDGTDNTTISDGSPRDKFLDKQKSGYGVYRAKNSQFNILYHEVDGVPTCQATLAAPQQSQLRQFVNILVDVAELYARAPTIPFQFCAALVCQMAGYTNKDTGELKVPYFPQIGTFTRGYFASEANKPKHMGDKVREQMNFMAAHAGADKIIFDIPMSQQGKGATEYHVRNAYLALIEAEKRAGYNENGNPKVKNVGAAMQFELSPNFQAALATSNDIKGVLPVVASYMRLHGETNMNESVKVLLQRVRNLNIAIAASRELENAKANDNSEIKNFANAQDPKPNAETTYTAPVIPAAVAGSPYPTASVTAATPTSPVAEITPGGPSMVDALGAIRAGTATPPPEPSAPPETPAPPNSPVVPPDSPVPEAAGVSPPGGPLPEPDDMVLAAIQAGKPDPAPEVKPEEIEMVELGANPPNNDEPVALDDIGVGLEDDAKVESKDEIEMADLSAQSTLEAEGKGLNADEIKVDMPAGFEEQEAIRQATVASGFAAIAEENKGITEDMESLGLDQVEQNVVEEATIATAAEIQAGQTPEAPEAEDKGLNADEIEGNMPPEFAEQEALRQAAVAAGFAAIAQENKADTEEMEPLGFDEVEQNVADEATIPTAAEIQAGQTPEPEQALGAMNVDQALSAGKFDEWFDAVSQTIPDSKAASDDAKIPTAAEIQTGQTPPAPETKVDLSGAMPKDPSLHDAWFAEQERRIRETPDHVAPAPLPAPSKGLSALQQMLELTENLVKSGSPKPPEAKTPTEPSPPMMLSEFAALGKGKPAADNNSPKPIQPAAPVVKPIPTLGELKGLKRPPPPPPPKQDPPPPMPLSQYAALKNVKPVASKFILPKSMQPAGAAPVQEIPAAPPPSPPSSKSADDLAKFAAGIMKDSHQANISGIKSKPDNENGPKTPRRGSSSS
jgi:hypothetical protein